MGGMLSHLRRTAIAKLVSLPLRRGLKVAAKAKWGSVPAGQIQTTFARQAQLSFNLFAPEPAFPASLKSF